MKLTKCKCYHKTNRWLPWTEGVCRGTQECDPCTCRGDRTKCDFYDHVREKAIKEVKEAVKQQLDSHDKTCVNCLYNDICVPDEMQICTDFKDARRYSRHEFVPGDEAYCIYNEVPYPVKITRSACSINDQGERHEVIMYTVTILDICIDCRWVVGSKVDKKRALYHTFAEAEAAIKEATKDGN